MRPVVRHLNISPGNVLDGKYEILRPIGSGGMGAVFAAKRLALDDTVAIKCILPAQNTEANRVRFMREAKAVARIRHPNVVQVFDFGDGGQYPPYMVMEYLRGPALAEVLARQSLIDREHALSIFGSICAAVEAGHRRGVVHRDLKPGNVILSIADDGRETVKVLDFGLARIADGSSMALTQPGALLGTCAYMAPEQIEGAPGGPSTDVFALGVILYQLMTGHLPFHGATQIAAMLKIAEGKYTPPQEHVDDLPETILDAIVAALKTDAGERPATAESLAQLAGVTHGKMSDMASSIDFGEEIERDPALVTQAAEASHAGEETMLQEGSGTRIRSQPGSDQEGAPFIGREAELESMREEFGVCGGGGGRITVLSGEAGVGKTRLMEKFLSWAQREGASIYRGRFYAYEGDRPPHETYLWMLSSQESQNSAGADNAPMSARDQINLGDDKWQAFETIAEAYAKRTRGRPLVLAVDDLQWATALDLEFLSYLNRGKQKSEVMVVATARTSVGRSDTDSDMQKWLIRMANQRVLTRIGVAPFTGREVRDWLTANFGSLRIRAEDVRRLARVTGGNPYYLAEVCRHLTASGRIIKHERGWSCDSLANVELPETVNSVMRAKIEAIEPAIREVLELASAVGEEFRFETVHTASGMDEDELDELLERAAKSGYLSEKNLAPGSDYRFANTTLRSVLYADLSKRKRRRLHRKVVEAIEKLYGAHRERVAKVLCYHYHAMGDWRATLESGIVAARAIDRDDVDNAQASLDRAREAAENLRLDGEVIDDLELANLEYLAGDLAGRSGRPEEAHDLLASATERAKAASDDDLLLDAMIAHSENLYAQGRLAEAAKIGKETISLSTRLEDLQRELVSRAQTSAYLSNMGNYAEAVKLLQPLIDSEDSPEFAQVRSLGFRELAWTETRQGKFAKAEEHAQKARDLAQVAGDNLLEYRALATLAVVYGESGAFEPSCELMLKALELARSMSLRRREGIELLNLGENYYLMKRHEEALTRTLEALAIFMETKDQATEGAARVNLGRIMLSKGDRDEGLVMLRRGIELCKRSGRPEYAGLASIEIGNSHLASEEFDAAQNAFEAAGALYRPVNSLYLWRVEFALAKVARARGDEAGAVSHAEEAANLIEAQRGTLSETVNSSGFAKHVADIRQFLTLRQAPGS